MEFPNLANDVETIQQVVTIPLEKVEEKGVVIVHCRFDGEGAIRIWQSTFLVDRNSSHKSKMLHAENISVYPQWTLVRGGGYTFTLYFEPLPGACNIFDLMEIIPQAGGFHVKEISRNVTDVYKVEIA